MARVLYIFVSATSISNNMTTIKLTIKIGTKPPNKHMFGPKNNKHRISSLRVGQMSVQDMPRLQQVVH